MASFIGRVEGGRLSLRASTSTSSQRYMFIPDDASVSVSTISNNREWFSTSYGGYNGYVVAQYVAVENDGGTARVTKSSGSMSILKAPSGSFLYSATNNTVVRLLDTTSVSGWYRVSSAQGTGWAQAQDLTILTYPDGESGGSNTSPYCYGVTKGTDYVLAYQKDSNGYYEYFHIPVGEQLPLWKATDDNTEFLTTYNGQEYYIFTDSVDIVETNTNTLSEGTSGIGVVKYKNLLCELGYYPYRLTDVFTGSMTIAVKLFQAKNNLSVDGMIGPATRAKFYNNPMRWSDNTVTTWLNAAQKGYYPPKQWFMDDDLWSSYPWPCQANQGATVGNSGNSITAMAMVMTTFFNRAVTPVELAEYTIDNFYRDQTGTTGVQENFFTDITAYDNDAIAYEDSTTNLANLKNYINNGKLVIARVTKPEYTAGASHVVIYRIDDYVHVLSPNSGKNPSQSFSYSEWDGANWFKAAYVYTRVNG